MSRIIVPVFLIMVLLGSTWLLFAPAGDPQPEIASRELPPDKAAVQTAPAVPAAAPPATPEKPTQRKSVTPADAEWPAVLKPWLGTWVSVLDAEAVRLELNERGEGTLVFRSLDDGAPRTQALRITVVSTNILDFTGTRNSASDPSHPIRKSYSLASWSPTAPTLLLFMETPQPDGRTARMPLAALVPQDARSLWKE